MDVIVRNVQYVCHTRIVFYSPEALYKMDTVHGGSVL